MSNHLSRGMRTAAALTVVGGILALAGSPAVLAQSSVASTTTTDAIPARPATLTLSTTYPSIIVSPGDVATFPLSVESPVDERVDLSLGQVTDGFDATFHGGDAVVTSVFTNATTDPALELRVRVPDDAAEGTDSLIVTGTAGSTSVDLPIDVVVSSADAGSVSLVANYPILSGDSAATYSFDLRLQNDTPRDVTFGLQGTGPDGWTVEVNPSGSDKASTALVKAGGSTNIKVTATPAKFAAAGRYLLDVVADGGTQQADAQLGVEITGSYDVSLDTSDGRLNTSIAAGSSGPVSLVVTNTGTAPLTDVTLTATTPTGWDMTFDPDTITGLDPSASTQVTGTITPAGNAVAGDYALTVKVASGDATDQLQLRTTVETSTMWGLVAVAVIAIAAIGLFLVFRRYGRR